MNSLIKAIKTNTARRKKIKKRIDEELNLSAEAKAETIQLKAGANSINRLIDEGAIIEGDGSVWGYIKKGTLEKFMSGENIYLGNLPDDFVGNIDIGHMDHATFPFPVGEWRKEDMALVDIGDGRQGIDISTATIDEDSIFIKELKRLGYEISLSIEAQFHLDWEATEDLGFPIIDELLIYAFAVCGDGKNVNSNGLQLKGESPMAEDTKKLVDQIEEGLKAELSVEEEVEIPVEAETAEETEEVKSNDESTEEQLEESEEPEGDENEEAESEEVAEDDDEAEGEEVDALEEALSVIEKLKARIDTLEGELAGRDEAYKSLKKTNRKLSAKVQKELEKKEKFMATVKDISVELLPEEDNTQKESEFKTGRRTIIGEI